MLKSVIYKILEQQDNIFPFSAVTRIKEEITEFKKDIYLTLFISLLVSLLILIFGDSSISKKIHQPIISPISNSQLTPLSKEKSKHEVFGFAPYWTFNKLDTVDFKVLTTLAYFGVPINSNGDLVRDDPGYYTFQSKDATRLFTKAHDNGTRVVLTLTQMDNWQIISLLDSSQAQANAVEQAVSEVEKRGIDGVNVDFEYSGNPGIIYRRKFTNFVENLAAEMHRRVPSSKVTVSVYAGSVKEPKIYDIKALSLISDGIFMMAYDFGFSGSDNAIPTAPLYGYKQGKYWYDVSTAVDDFLKLMPAEKLILGVPWYSYNYAVYEPAIKAETLPYWLARAITQTYASVIENIHPNNPGIANYKSGWDNFGKVSWKSYYDETRGVWRIVFYDDVKSLSAKFDFAKNKNLGGVGIWALGFEDGRDEFWHLLGEKFGVKLADSNVYRKAIYEVLEDI